MKKRQLHVITTGKQQPERLAEMIASIHPYVDAIHLREKAKTARELYDILHVLADMEVPFSKLIINDRVDVAYVAKTAGVHLAYHSLPVDRVKHHFPNLKVGCSVHSIEEAGLAEKQGADYLLFGHIFPTLSKPGQQPRGLNVLESLSDKALVPVLAIGGIKPDNVEEVIDAGANGIAVMSGIMEAENPLEAIRKYRDSLFL